MHDGIPLNGPRSWQMIYLDPERVAAEFQGAIKAEDILLRPVVEDPQLRGLMLRLFSEIVASAPEDTAVEEALLLCLMRVSRYHLCARRPDKSGTPPSRWPGNISMMPPKRKSLSRSLLPSAVSAAFS